MFPIFSPTCLLFPTDHETLYFWHRMFVCIFKNRNENTSFVLKTDSVAYYIGEFMLLLVPINNDKGFIYFENISKFYGRRCRLTRLSVSRDFIYISLLTRVNYRNIYLYFNSHVTVCGNTEEYFLHNTRCAWKIKIEKGPPSQLIHVIVVRNYTEDGVS